MADILGKKVGMTNIFDEEGRFVPITLIEAGPSVVLGIRSVDKEGYSAVILGYGEKKASRTSRPLKGWFDKIKASPKKFVKEIRPAGTEYRTGDTVTVKAFNPGDYVDVTGTSIGKGFQGGIKRWHWRGGEAGHGSMFHRAPGSIGASSFPSRVHKGKTLPGHMGCEKTTVKNLKVIMVDEEKNIMGVKGAVPGYKGNFLVIGHAKGKPVKAEKKDDKKA